MTTAVLLSRGAIGMARLSDDLASQGVRVLVALDDERDLVRHVVRHAPDCIIFDFLEPTDALFQVIDALRATALLPFVVLVQRSSVADIERAVAAGIHVFVVNGYVSARWPGLIQLAYARWRHEQSVKQSLDELAQRLEDRKSVERAKGILMQARQLTDDAAFEMLRTVSMHANQRLGRVSEQIIHSARFAEAVNRSGQLRMLSQRMVKLYLLQLAGVQVARSQVILLESVQRADENLHLLSKKLAPPATPEDLAPVLQIWSRLRADLLDAPKVERVASLNLLAEKLLNEAEHLTETLKARGAVASLQVLNVAGRQRMLSQRFSKYALLSLLGANVPELNVLSGQQETRDTFQANQAYLRAAPLLTPEIRESLDQADQAWWQMLHGVTSARATTGPALKERIDRLASASENLLEVFERLAVSYERSLDLLLG